MAVSRHQPAQRGVLGVHHGYFRAHRHFLLAGSHFEGEIDYGLIGYRQGDAPLGFCLEPGMLAPHLIVTHGKFRHPVGAIVTG